MITLSPPLRLITGLPLWFNKIKHLIVALFLLKDGLSGRGAELRGILLLHFVLACVSSLMIWLVWWAHFRARRRTVSLPNYRLAIEFLAVGIVALTGHLGGFLSGVNGPG